MKKIIIGDGQNNRIFIAVQQSIERQLISKLHLIGYPFQGLFLISFVYAWFEDDLIEK